MQVVLKSIRGIRDVRRASEGMVTRIAKAANRKAVSKAATPMLQDARAKAPILTGALRKSLTKRVRTVGTGVSAKIGGRRGMPGGRYLHLVEFGSSRRSPHPFLRPAFEATKAESIRVYRQSIWGDIRIETAKAKVRASGGR